MSTIRNLFVLFGLTTCIHCQTFAKAILIPVDSIFNNISNISEIKVIGYLGDSIMEYINIGSQDTFKLYCKWKDYSESSIKIMKEYDSTYNSWEGTFPEVGETLLMVNYNFIGARILFARKANNHYRFWDPKSIPFANSVFFIPKKGVFKPTGLCISGYQEETGFHCSDGFLMGENEFDKRKAIR